MLIDTYSLEEKTETVMRRLFELVKNILCLKVNYVNNKKGSNKPRSGEELISVPTDCDFANVTVMDLDLQKE